MMRCFGRFDGRITSRQALDISCVKARLPLPQRLNSSLDSSTLESLKVVQDLYHIETEDLRGMRNSACFLLFLPYNTSGEPWRNLRQRANNNLELEIWISDKYPALCELLSPRI